MIAALGVELRRAQARRLYRVLVLVALLGITVIALAAFLSSEPDTPNAYSAGDIWAGFEDADGDTGDANTLGQTTPLFLLMGLLGGASFVGAEYKAGTTTTLLTWEPRRVRVMTAKLLAAAIVAALSYVALQVVLGASLLPVVRIRGADTGLDSEFYRLVGGLLLRGGLLTGVCAVLGASIAALGRNTTAAVAVVLGYIAVAEPILRGLRPGWAPWFLIENIVIVVSGGAQSVPHTSRSAASALILVVLYVGAVAAVAVGVFRRRDVT